MRYGSQLQNILLGQLRYKQSKYAFCGFLHIYMQCGNGKQEAFTLNSKCIACIVPLLLADPLTQNNFLPLGNEPSLTENQSKTSVIIPLLNPFQLTITIIILFILVITLAQQVLNKNKNYPLIEKSLKAPVNYS